MPPKCVVCLASLADCEGTGRSSFLGSSRDTKDRPCSICQAAFVPFARKHNIELKGGQATTAQLLSLSSDAVLGKPFHAWSADQRLRVAQSKHSKSSRSLRSVVGAGEQSWFSKAAQSPAGSHSKHSPAAAAGKSSAPASSFDNGILLKSWSRHRIGDDDEFDLPPERLQRKESESSDSEADVTDSPAPASTSHGSSAWTASEGGGVPSTAATGPLPAAAAGEEDDEANEFFVDDATGLYYVYDAETGEYLQLPDDLSKLVEEGAAEAPHSQVDDTDPGSASVAGDVPNVEHAAPGDPSAGDGSDRKSVMTASPQYYFDELTGKYCYMDDSQKMVYIDGLPDFSSVGGSELADISTVTAADTASTRMPKGAAKPAAAKPKPLEPKKALDPKQEVKQLKQQLRRTTKLAVAAAVAAKQASLQYNTPQAALSSWLRGQRVPEPNLDMIVATYKRIMRQATLDSYGSSIAVRSVATPRPSAVFKSNTPRLMGHQPSGTASPAGVTMVQIVLPNKKKTQKQGRTKPKSKRKLRKVKLARPQRAARRPSSRVEQLGSDASETEEAAINVFLHGRQSRSRSRSKSASARRPASPDGKALPMRMWSTSPTHRATKSPAHALRTLNHGDEYDISNDTKMRELQARVKRSAEKSARLGAVPAVLQDVGDIFERHGLLDSNPSSPSPLTGRTGVESASILEHDELDDDDVSAPAAFEAASRKEPVRTALKTEDVLMDAISERMERLNSLLHASSGP